MSFPRYPRYKDSGVEWLGEVPEHWNPVPIKHLGKLKGGAGFPHDEQGLHGEELPFHKVNALARAVEGVIHSSENTISRGTAERLGAYVFPPGTIVFAKVGAALLLGRLCRLSTDACIDNNMMGLVVDGSGFDVRYVQSAMSMVRFDLIANPGAVPSLNEAQIGDLHLAFPPLEEQRLIAHFLSRETAKIDALIAEQRCLIDLLKEKRQAVISHAVTRGLNPDAPMKPSNIAWLGDVPAHWEVVPLKRVITTIEQGWSPQCENYPAEGSDEWAVLKVGCVNGGEFRPWENKSLPPALQPIPELGIQAGDVLISRANTRELVGSTAVVKDDYPRLMLCDKLYRVRMLQKQCLPEFLAYYLGSRVARGQIELGATGASASMLNIGQATVLEMPVPVPPPTVQREIVRFLDMSTVAANTLTSEAEHAIALLQERRTALISAAVTGKIDVRNIGEAA